MVESSLQSSNINSLWLGNIYENIKNLELMTRLSREGCATLLDYVQMSPEQRMILMADVQYKNLRMIFNELALLIGDLAPIIGETKAKSYYEKLKPVEAFIDKKSLFIQEQYKASRNGIVSSSTTSFFFETSVYLENIRRQLIIEISEILYIKEDSQVKRW